MHAYFYEDHILINYYVKVVVVVVVLEQLSTLYSRNFWAMNLGGRRAYWRA